MNRRNFMKISAAAGGVLIGAAPAAAEPADWTIENEHFSLSLDPASGALSSLIVKAQPKRPDWREASAGKLQDLLAIAGLPVQLHRRVGA